MIIDNFEILNLILKNFKKNLIKFFNYTSFINYQNIMPYERISSVYFVWVFFLPKPLFSSNEYRLIWCNILYPASLSLWHDMLFPKTSLRSKPIFYIDFVFLLLHLLLFLCVDGRIWNRLVGVGGKFALP